MKLGENLKNWNLRFESLVSEEVTETKRETVTGEHAFESLVSEEVTETSSGKGTPEHKFESLVSEEVTETLL